jgi:4-nitrophenyl phosphatase
MSAFDYNELMKSDNKLASIKNLIIDMDGVLWRGQTPMPGLPAFFASLRRLGFNFVLATNNAASTPAQYVEKLASFDVQVDPSQILTSAEATGSYLSKKYPPGTAVFIIGEEGLHQAMTSRGFRPVTVDEVLAGATAALVVVGFTRNVTYPDFAAGSLLIHKGANFVGTNPDVTIPSEWGPLPGAGALQALITAATGVKATTIGKPGPAIFREAMARLGSTAADTAVVGDRLNTDIAGGKAAGLVTILLLSGISQRADLSANGVQPDYVFDDIRALAAYLEREIGD